MKVLRLAGAEQGWEPLGRRGLLVMLESEPFKEVLVQRCLGPRSQPTEVGQVVAHLLDDLDLLI